MKTPKAKLSRLLQPPGDQFIREISLRELILSTRPVQEFRVETESISVEMRETCLCCGISASDQT